MNNTTESAVEVGDEVVRAAGELSATVKDAAKAAAETGVDHEEVRGWLTTVFKAIMAVRFPPDFSRRDLESSRVG